MINILYQENKPFYLSLLFSAVIHLVVIYSLSSIQPEVFRKPLKTLEVTYQALKPKKEQVAKTKFQDIKLVQEKVAPKIDVLSKRHEKLGTFGEKIRDISKFKSKVHLNKKEVPKIQTLDVSRKISVPFIKSEKITNPKYLSYNQSIRQKIRQRAYQYVNHADFDSGEVYLTFVLLADGILKDLKVIDRKTSANDYLRTVGIRSVEESNPFLPFPEDLNFPELTFNVVISFEVSE